MKGKIFLFILCYIIWCLFSWVPDLPHLILGVFASLFVVYVMGGLFTGSAIDAAAPLKIVYFAAVFVPLVLWEFIKANIEMAYYVLNPALPIKPGMIKLNTKIRSEIGLSMLANAVTLYPGMVSVDVDGDNGVILIHCVRLEGDNKSLWVENSFARLERVLSKIFK